MNLNSKLNKKNTVDTVGEYKKVLLEDVSRKNFSKKFKLGDKVVLSQNMLFNQLQSGIVKDFFQQFVGKEVTISMMDDNSDLIFFKEMLSHKDYSPIGHLIDYSLILRDGLNCYVSRKDNVNTGFCVIDEIGTFGQDEEGNYKIFSTKEEALQYARNVTSGSDKNKNNTSMDEEYFANMSQLYFQEVLAE